MSATKTFLVSGDTVRVRDAEAVAAFDALPAKTYTIKFDERAGEFFLEEIDDFTLPDKVYGNNPRHAERILDTFDQRPGQTGVLLNGIKGAGKTLLAKQISVIGKTRGIPTIVINKDWHGDEFNSFIQSINTPSIILFDEFEKIYGFQEQRKILTLFDGVFNSRKLFVVTTNDSRDVSEFMRNRPGRMYYSFTFSTLDQDFIKEFLEDRLKDKSQIDEILNYTKVFSFFNFDMLAAVVEEMNRYNESLSDVLDVLNIEPENKHTDTYRVDLVVIGRSFTLDKSLGGFQPNSFEYDVYCNDMIPSVVKHDTEVANILGYKDGNSQPESGLTSSIAPFGNQQFITFNSSCITAFDQSTSTFIYTSDYNGTEVQLHVTRNDPIKEWSYYQDV